MFDLSGKRIVVIGGTSGIGLGITKACKELGAHLIVARRSPEKLTSTQKELGKQIEIHCLDISQPGEIQSFFDKLDPFDHVAVSAATVSWGNFGAMLEKDEQASFRSKFWGQYYTAKFGYPKIKEGGSIIFFAGCWSQKPIFGAAIPSSINGAIESLARALALELAPIRVNVISPGIIDTPVFSGISESEKKAFFEKTAKSLPLKKIGHPEEIAMTAIYLMANTYTTGSTLYVDGGDTLR
ncbi:MAG: SDR family oxidoreductase [Proteobacteria bacterium]|nr:SDR family oxidoreductase [Pseudomonadota bacterium]